MPSAQAFAQPDHRVPTLCDGLGFVRTCECNEVGNRPAFRPLFRPWPVHSKRQHRASRRLCAGHSVFAAQPTHTALAPMRSISTLNAIALLSFALIVPCLGTAQAQVSAAPNDGASPLRLRIVGGLAGLNQFTRHEEPFWTRDLPRLSGGRATAEIVPFDRAGIRGQEMLRLVQLGAVPFGTTILGLTATEVPELSAPDLAGLNPDIETARRTLSAFRPYLESLLRDRFGVEVLALYVYPAQVTFCTKALTGLADLNGRRVRVSNSSQADMVTALGGTPVQTGFTEIVSNVRNGNIDCAITGTMSRCQPRNRTCSARPRGDR